MLAYHVQISHILSWQRDFGPDRFDQIPPHGRWQHFEVGNVPRVDSMLKEWKEEGCDKLELTRRLIDLFFVSVLLDAGAGDVWRYKEPQTDDVYERSEGIAVASLHMFKSHAFTASVSGKAPIVDGKSRRTDFLRVTLSPRCSLTWLFCRERSGRLDNGCTRRWLPSVGHQPNAGNRVPRSPSQQSGSFPAIATRCVRKGRTPGKCRR